MKTLSKTTTSHFFSSPDGYALLIARWRALAQDKVARKQLCAICHLLYLILRGKNWHKGFSGPTNRKKLENGARPSATSVLLAIHGSHYDKSLLAIFDGILVDDALDRVRELLPKCGYYENATDLSPYREDVTAMELAA